MKARISCLFVLVGILFTLTIYFVSTFPDDKSQESVGEIETVDTYKTFTYIITEVDGNQYYGESIDGKTKIYFNRDRVKYPITDSINVHDRILAYVEPENHIDGIVKVEKIKSSKK